MIKGKKTLKVLVLLFLVSSIILLIIFCALFLYARRNIDYYADELLFKSRQRIGATKLYYYDEYGKPCEYCILSPADNKRLWYSYGEISNNLKSAFISTEDREFFSHSGINYNIKYIFLQQQK